MIMDSSPQTRFSLIEKIKNPHDAEAWSEFAEIYYPLVIRMCRQKGLQHADATDVAQEVLGRVARAVKTYRQDQPGSTFRGWLYRITRNLTIDFFRKQKRDPLAKVAHREELNTIQEPTANESRDFNLAFRKQMFSVVAAIVQQQVQPQTWLAFWKTEVEHQDVAAVANELSMTTGAVYVARSRVIARLRQETQKRMNETGSSVTDLGKRENEQ